ncbi:MAG TPA: PIN domain nuclease [Candidatus Bathyarchaeota archaeon]|nr:PIN domain nuclease [Candidatus Bathyarchaeota archaeon]
MSRRGFTVLLDTSFLLPSFGVDVGRDVADGLRLLAKHRDEVTIYYSRYSLLEALLILLREVKRGRLKLEEACEMVEAGVTSITYGLEASVESPEAFAEALKLYVMGHRDIFDNMLYATALVNEMFFLTIDDELRKILRENGLKDITLTLKELREKLG